MATYVLIEEYNERRYSKPVGITSDLAAANKWYDADRSKRSFRCFEDECTFGRGTEGAPSVMIEQAHERKPAGGDAETEQQQLERLRARIKRDQARLDGMTNRRKQA